MSWKLFKDKICICHSLATTFVVVLFAKIWSMGQEWCRFGQVFFVAYKKTI